MKSVTNYFFLSISAMILAVMIHCSSAPSIANGPGSSTVVGKVTRNSEICSGASVIIRSRDYLPSDRILKEMDSIQIDTMVKTDAEGLFSFYAIPAGIYIVNAISADSQYSILEDSVVVGDRAALIDTQEFRLEAPGTMKGMVSPLKNDGSDSIFIFGLDNYAITDSNGVYLFDNIPAGYYRIIFVTTSGGYHEDNISSAMITSNDTIMLPPRYRIVYRKTGDAEGSVPTDGRLYTHGESVTLIGNIGNLQYGDSAFIGWNTRPDYGGRTCKPGDTLIIDTSNIILYTQWTRDSTCTLSYSLNGEKADGDLPATNCYEAGAIVIVSGNIGNLQRDNCTFIGWKRADDETDRLYRGGDTLRMDSSNILLNAQWTRNPTYTITYAGNGSSEGHVPVDRNFYEEEAQVIIPGNVGGLARNDFYFTGWNTKTDGTGTDYVNGNALTIKNEAVMLYAQWEPKPTFSVTYSGNGAESGTVPEDATRYKTGARVTVQGNTGDLAIPHAVFAGWNTMNNGSGTAYRAGDTFTQDSTDDTLFAQWESAYSVTYDGNGNSGGSVPIDANVYYAGAGVSVHGNTGNLVKEHHVFAGWSLDAEGEGTGYVPGDRFEIATANITLYARWNPTFTVVYTGTGADGGTVPEDTNRYQAGDRVTVSGNTGGLTRKTALFSGWNTQPDGQGTSYAAGDIFSIGPSDDTLFAQWKPVYTVTYDGNIPDDGNVPEDDNRYENGDRVTVQGNVAGLSKDNATFSGWSTQKDSNGTYYLPGESFTISNGNVTLFAVWKVMYPLVYYGNGNTAGTPPDTMYYEVHSRVTVVHPGNLEKECCSFTGWNSAADGSGSDYLPGAVIDISTADTIRLYARWRRGQVTILFNAGGGSAINDLTVNCGDQITAPSPVPVKKGYTFAGWYDDAACLNAWDFNATITDPLVLYAKWVIMDIDGNIYSEITIGNQVWMVENLKSTRYTDGTGIPLVSEASGWEELTTGGYCWYNNDTINKKAYGALYNWYAVSDARKLAPDGWHIPYDAELTTLETYLITNGHNWDASTSRSSFAKSLSATTGWNISTVEGSPGYDMTANNTSGFSALPGGYRYSDGRFFDIGLKANWWSSTESNDSTAMYRDMNYNQSTFYRIANRKQLGYAVRCIRD